MNGMLFYPLLQRTCSNHASLLHCSTGYSCCTPKRSSKNICFWTSWEGMTGGPQTDRSNTEHPPGGYIFGCLYGSVHSWFPAHDLIKNGYICRDGIFYLPSNHHENGLINGSSWFAPSTTSLCCFNGQQLIVMVFMHPITRGLSFSHLNLGTCNLFRWILRVWTLCQFRYGEYAWKYNITKRSNVFISCALTV